MKNYFTDNCLELELERKENKVLVQITSDYKYSNHKEMLYVNKDNIVRDIKDLCKSLQIHELTRLRVSFREIDWYDDEVDVYTTPIVLYDCITDSIKHGERQHGSIPKDWSVYLILEFTDIKTAEPLLTTIKYILGGLFTADIEKDLLDKLKKVSLPQ